MEAGEIKFTFDSRDENVSTVGELVKKLCEMIPISEKLAYQIELCVVEACNNVVEHSYLDKPGNNVELVFFSDGKQIRLTIIDSGIPRKNKIKDAIEFNPDDVNTLPEGGMGLYIIKEIMDENEYYSENGKNYFTLTRYI